MDAATTPSPTTIPCPPAARQTLGADAPATLAAIGNPALLAAPPVALLCSARCPGSLILQTFDLARALRDARATVIGGFHTPLEQEALALLLRGDAPLIICPARGIGTLHLPTPWRAPLAAGRLLVLSPFPDSARRVTAGLATTRNRLVAALAECLLIPHADPAGRTAALARAALAGGKPTLTLADPANAHLIAAGARPIPPTPWPPTRSS